MMPGLHPGDPSRVGVYRTERRLGAGGQGVVYEAYGPAGERVAVKIPSPEILALPGARARLAKEVAAARRVASFCTARILDADTGGEQPYLVSEFVPGHNLSVVVREHGPFRGDALIRLAMGLATAVAAIHGAGVVHRDLKPANVLIGPDGPRVIDFGLARSEDMTLTNGVAGGTYGYMAPEVLRGKPPTAAADIFAWAAMVLFAATGKHPFGGAHDAEIIYRTVEHEPDTSLLPEPLPALVDAALHRGDPSSRPTARTLLAGLLGLVEDTAASVLLSAGAEAASAVRADAGDLAAQQGLAERAEAAYQVLSRPAQTRAREVLLRFLVAGKAADGSQDNARTADEQEFTEDRTAEEQKVLQEVLAAFTAEGILVRTGTGIRPASLALAHAWPRMRNWLASDREGLRRLRALGDATAAWERGGRRPDELLRGDALREHADAYADAPAHLRPTPAERRLLTVSQQAEARRATRKRRVLMLVSVLVALVLVAGTLALYQTRISRTQAEQDAARTAAAIAESVRTSDPEAAMLLSAAAWRIADVDDSRAALYDSLNHGVRQVTDNPVLVPETRPVLGVSDQLLPGGRLATVVAGKAAEVWDLGAQRRTGFAPLTANTGDTATMARFAEDGRRVVAPQGDSGGARTVTLTEGTRRRGPVLGKVHTVAVDNISRDADRAVLTWVEDDGIRQIVVDTATGRILWSRLVDYGSAAPVLSPDGKSIAVCTPKKPARLVDLRTGGERTLTRLAGGWDTFVECGDESQMAFSSDGAYLLTALDGMSGLLWNTRTATARHDLSFPVDELSYQWAVDETGTLVAAAVRGRIMVWQRQGADLLEAASIPTARLDAGAQGAGEVWALAFDDEDRRLRFIENDRRIRSVDLSWLAREPDGEEGRRAVFAAHAQAVLHYSFDKDTLELTTGGRRRQLKTAGSPLLSLVDTVVGTFSADGKLYAHIVDDGEDRPSLLQVWSTKTGHPHGPLIDLRGKDEPEAIAFAPDGRRIAVSRLDARRYTRRTIEVWDLATSRRTAVFPDAGAAELAFSPDGTLLVTSAGDRIDLVSKEVRRQALGPAGARDVAFSEDGQALAVSTDRGSIDLWDATATRRIGAVPSMGSTDSPVTGLRFSPDGRLLAGVDDTGVRLWDVPDRRRLGGPLRLAGGGHISVAFDISGRLHVASTLNRHLTIDLDPQSIINEICRSVGRDLNTEEWEQYLPGRTRHRVC